MIFNRAMCMALDRTLPLTRPTQFTVSPSDSPTLNIGLSNVRLPFKFLRSPSPTDRFEPPCTDRPHGSIGRVRCEA